MPDVIAVDEFHAVRFLVQGEYKYKCEIENEIRKSELFKKLKSPEIRADNIKLIHRAQSIERFIDDIVSTIHVDTDAEGSEPIYVVPVKARI